MPNALQILKRFPSVGSNPENQSISYNFNRNYTHNMKVLLVLRLHSLSNQRELLCRSCSRSRNRNRKQLLHNCCIPEHLIRNRNHSHSYLDIHMDTCRHLQVLSITGKLKQLCYLHCSLSRVIAFYAHHNTPHHTTQQSQYTGVERGRHAAQGRHRPPLHALRPTGAAYAEHTAVRTFYHPHIYIMLPIGRHYLRRHVLVFPAHFGGVLCCSVCDFVFIFLLSCQSKCYVFSIYFCFLFMFNRFFAYTAKLLTQLN
jgi:hypothetical protein